LEKDFLKRIGYGDEILIAILPLTTSEYGVLLVDNYHSGKQIQSVTRYLLKQYAHGLSAVIQRWYATENFKLLASQTGHEIRGALQSIVSYNCLYKKHLAPELFIKAQQQIEYQTNRAKDIVSAFIEHTKAENRYWVLKKMYSSLFIILEQAVLAVTPEAEQEEISILFHKTGDIRLALDLEKMGMVIKNLLRNAIRAIPKGLPQERKKIVIGYKHNRKIRCIVITVKDQGTGIAPGELGKIFEPFRGMGTGLGLSLSRQIVERHGGSMKVQSALNKGTIFFIFLPEEE